MAWLLAALAAGLTRQRNSPTLANPDFCRGKRTNDQNGVNVPSKREVE